MFCGTISGGLAKIGLPRSFRLEVRLLPLQASGAGLGDEPHPALLVDYLPMLSGVVEFDIAGPGDFESAEFM